MVFNGSSWFALVFCVMFGHFGPYEESALREFKGICFKLLGSFLIQENREKKHWLFLCFVCFSRIFWGVHCMELFVFCVIFQIFWGVCFLCLFPLKTVVLLVCSCLSYGFLYFLFGIFWDFFVGVSMGCLIFVDVFSMGFLGLFYVRFFGGFC